MTAVARKEPFGRPTKYQGDKTLKKVQACIKEGMSHRQIARHLGISSPTLYLWAEKYPDFSNILQKARDELVSRYERALLGQAEGNVTGNATAGIFMLKNLAPDEYRDRREHKVEVTDTLDLDFTGFDEAIDADYEEVDD